MATTDTWDSPALDQSINADLPAIKNKFQALVKGDPSLVQNPPVGAKRLVEIDSGNWQVQQYNGHTWSNIGKLKMDVDTVDGYDAAITPTANTVAVRNASGLLQDSITGNAATASSAATLSQTLAVNKGGTGATTSEAARSNLGAAPTSHASATATHGVGSDAVYGHLKLSDATDSLSGVGGGVAATPAAVKDAKDAAISAGAAASAAQQTADAAASAAGTAQQTADAAVSAADKAQQTADSAVVKAEEAASKAGLPLGHFYAHPYPTPIEGSLHCNGGLNSRELYADLFAFAQANKQVISEQEWQETAEACGGYCSYYSNGDGTSTFRMPKFAPHIQISLIAASAGTYHKPGLPNIEAGWTTGWNNAHIPTIQTSGAVKTISNSAYGVSYGVGNQTNNPWRVNFDASLFNSIYGSSTTVQPEFQEWIICVVAFGKATNVGEVDVANVMSAVSQVQAQVTEAIEIDSSGYSSSQHWVRYVDGRQIIYSNWGASFSNSQRITFVKSFKTNPGLIGFDNETHPSNMEWRPKFSDITATYFRINDWAYGSASKSGCWIAFGTWK